MKKTILKSTKSILIAAAVCASLLFGIFASVTADSASTVKVISGASIIEIF